MRLNAHLKTSGENDLSDEESRCPELLLSAIVCGAPAGEGRGRETKGQRWIKIHDNVQSLAMIASLMFGSNRPLLVFTKSFVFAFPPRTAYIRSGGR
jgi:hypothetical protein